MKKVGDYEFDETTETYKLMAWDSHYEFFFYGSTFWIFGDCNSDGADGSVYDFLGFKHYNFRNEYTDYHYKLYKLYNQSLDLTSHHIRIYHDSNVPGKNLYVNYVFYLTYSNQPVVPFEVLTKDDVSSTYDVDDLTLECIELPRVGSKANFLYGGYNFTLEGYVGPSNGNVNIYDNGTLLHSDVPLYREKYGFSYFYASNELLGGIHNISIVNCNGNTVGVSKLYYKPTSSVAFNLLYKFKFIHRFHLFH